MLQVFFNFLSFKAALKNFSASQPLKSWENLWSHGNKSVMGRVLSIRLAIPVFPVGIVGWFHWAVSSIWTVSALLRCLHDPHDAPEGRVASLWDMGHCRAGKVPQRDPTLLPGSPRCSAGLWYQQTGKRKECDWKCKYQFWNVPSVILNINKYPRKFKLYILPLHFWFSTGNILQSPVVAPGAGEILHPWIDCHMADRQQDGSGTRSEGLRAGARRGKFI